MTWKYLQCLEVYADEDIAEEFKGGFVQKFHRQSCCISEQFLRELRKLQTNGFPKIILTFVDSHRVPVCLPSADSSKAIIDARWPFNFNRYLLASEIKKRRMLGIAIRDCLLNIADEHAWDKVFIERIYSEAELRNFSFSGKSKASWPSPNSKFRVRVAFDWKLETIDLTAVLFQNRSSKELSRIELGDIVPGIAQLSFAICQEHGKWISDTEFQISVSDFTQKQLHVSFGEKMK